MIEPPDEYTGAIAVFLEEHGIAVTWHNNWQFSIGGVGDQWVICVVDNENEVKCVEFGSGTDNFIGLVDPIYIELADPKLFDRLLALLHWCGAATIQNSPIPQTTTSHSGVVLK